jgi:uncharacterized membrane protein
MNKLALNHARLWIAVIIGGVVFCLLPGDWSLITRILTSWNCAIALFLILISIWMTRLTAEQICLRFIDEDETASVILVVCIMAAMLSLVSIVAFLSTIKQTAGMERAVHIGLAALTVANSWTLVPTMFTLHYADMFYSVKPDSRPLHFPETSDRCRLPDFRRGDHLRLNSQGRDRADGHFISFQCGDLGFCDQRYCRADWR